MKLLLWMAIVTQLITSQMAQAADNDSDISAAPYRNVLSSVKHGLAKESVSITPTVVGLPSKIAWSVTKNALHGGKQEGCDLITIDNGKIKIELVPQRGLSILSVRQGDLRLGWNSPVKEVVHPKWVNLASRGGLGWLEGFNEFMVRCGMEYAGHPGTDEFTDNTGGKAQMDLSLHGRIGNLPASEVIVLIDRKPPHRIRVRGSVHERQFYGPKLELVAEVSTVPGSDTFEIADEVINHGATEQEFEMIYHSNYGRPLLEKGAKALIAAKTVTPMNANAAKGMNSYETYLGPTAGYAEQVYLIEPYANDKQQAVVLLHDAAGKRGASIRWSTKQLPYFTLWKNTALEADGYVTGLEPGTSFPFNRMVERKFGRVPKLKPGESRRFELTYGLHDTAEEVAAVQSEIESIQADRKTKVVANPPKVD
jgi:hypothetical protein